MVDFKADLRIATVEILEKNHVKYKKTDDLHALLIRLNTFWEKYITPYKREVFVSEELSKGLGTYPQFVQAAFAKMIEWVKNGVDINCFQSRGLYGKGSRDYQNMLYDIVHLHLSAGKDDVKPVIKKNGFAKPGQYLLLARFDEASAYFVKIMKHPQPLDKDGNISTEWISQDILGIMEHNWPELLAGKKLDNAALCDEEGNHIDLDDKAIATLTSNHVNTFLSRNGALYMAGAGMMSSGDSFSAVLKADKLLNNVEIARIFYEENEMKLCKAFENLLKKHGRKLPANFDIHYDYVDVLGCFVILDRNSGVAYDCRSGKIYLFFE